MTDILTHIEAGIMTGRSADHMRYGLEHGPQYRTIQAVRPQQWTVLGDEIVCRFLLDAVFGGKRLVTIEIEETFLVPAHDPRIFHIRAVFRSVNGIGRTGGRHDHARHASRIPGLRAGLDRVRKLAGR